MTATQFRKSRNCKQFKDVAFTKQEEKVIDIFMNQYAKYISKTDLKQRRLKG